MLHSTHKFQTKFQKYFRASVFTAVFVSLSGFSQVSIAADSFQEALAEGKFTLNLRLRYENVSHDAFTLDANAVTLRTRFGYGTADYNGFKAFIEGDFTRDMEPNNFNNTINGNSARSSGGGIYCESSSPTINGKGIYPVVADPASTRLNRLTLSYSGFDDTVITGGRQRIKLDNDRFIGNVGFRQNEQTLDAIRLTNSSLEGIKLDYTYIWQVQPDFWIRLCGRLVGRRYSPAAYVL